MQEELGQHKGYEYARTQNPTRAALEPNIAAIEGGKAAFAFASGMAAIDAITTLLKSGDHVVVTDNTYGGTFRLFDKVLTTLRLDVQLRRHVAARARSSRRSRPKTKMLFVETPTNPVLRLTDIAAVAAIARAARHPARRRQHVREPLRAAADRVRRRPGRAQHDEVPERPQRQHRRHRRSRSRDEDIEWLQFIQNAAGAILSPFDSWLVLRGTKTLRGAHGAAQRQRPGARASSCRRTQGIEQVIYPGLPRPSAARAGEAADARLRRDGVVRRRHVRGARAGCCNRVRLMALAESLGGVETLISHPASMTHASVPPERRAAIGLTDSLVRISAGIEDVEDLIDDLEQALGS